MSFFSRIATALAVLLLTPPPVSGAEPMPLGAADGGTGVGGPTARTLPGGTVAATMRDGSDSRLALGLAAGLTDALDLSVALGSPDPGADRLAARAGLRMRLADQGDRRPALAVGVTADPAAPDPGFYIVGSRTVGRVDLHAGIGWGGPEGGSDGVLGRGRPFGAIDVALPTSAPLWLYAAVPPRFGTAEAGRTRAIPVDAGLVWRARPWLDLEAGLRGGRSVLARAVLRYDAEDWRALGPLPPAPRAGPAPTGRAALEPVADAALVDLAREAGLPVASVERTGAGMTVRLDLPDDAPAARVAGRTARLLTRHVPAGVERFDIVLARLGLPGSAVTLYRRDIELGADGRLGPEALWRRARPRPAAAARTPGAPAGRRWWLTVAPRAELDVSAPERALIERHTVGLAGRLRPTARTLIGADLRYGIDDSLPAFRFDRGTPPVRSDPWMPVQGWTLERGFAAALSAPTPGLTTAAMAGLLERDYAGVAVAGLWRAFDGRAGIEAELSAGRLRRPWLAPGTAGPPTWTARAGLRYAAPVPGLELTAGVNRFLAGDAGLDAGLSRRFDNGVEIALDLTASTGARGADRAVGTGLRLTVPLMRGLSHVEARGELAVAPILRDAGQRPRLPIDLAALRRPVDYADVARGWPRLLD